jgi:hypothetical protein
MLRQSGIIPIQVVVLIAPPAVAAAIAPAFQALTPLTHSWGPLSGPPRSSAVPQQGTFDNDATRDDTSSVTSVIESSESLSLSRSLSRYGL